MIVKDSEHFITHPKKPGWYPDALEGIGATLLLSFLLGLGAFLVGLVVGIAADALFLNGPGFGANEATGEQIGWLMASIVGATVAGTITYCKILPRVGFKPTCFSTPEHKNAHREFNSLPSEAQVHALDAYEAVAAYKEEPGRYSQYSDDGYNPEWRLFNRAVKVWEETYNTLRRTYRDDSDVQLHEDRLKAAEETLKTLGGGS